MQAVRNTESGVTVVDLPEPDGEGQLVEVVSSGICGSDLHMIGWGPLPATLGHEIGGQLSDGTPVAPVVFMGGLLRPQFTDPQPRAIAQVAARK